MLLSKEEIELILRKINNNTASKEEIRLFNSWYNSFDDSKTYVNSFNNQKDLKRAIWNRIAFKTKIKPLNQHIYFRIAAASVILGVFSVLFYLSSVSNDKSYDLVEAVVLEGTSNSKVLLYSTLEDFLDSTTFLDLTKIKEEKYVNKINTGKGQFIKLILPDGTKVSLSAGSQLNLNTDFETGSNRIVYLEGEAYFEVSKDINRPFDVIVKDQKIQVLGTKFNVKAYNHQKEVVTTLLEGSIKLDNGKDSRVLTPKEIAISSEEGIEVKKELSLPKIAWRSLNFEFENESIESVLAQLSNWYNLKIELTNPTPNFKISGKIPRGTSISDLQIILKNLTQGNVELKNDVLHLTFSK